MDEIITGHCTVTADQTDQRGDRPPVFHRAVCFNRLAENAAANLHRGTTVTLTFEFTDDSYMPDGADTRCVASRPAGPLDQSVPAADRRPCVPSRWGRRR